MSGIVMILKKSTPACIIEEVSSLCLWNASMAVTLILRAFKNAYLIKGLKKIFLLSLVLRSSFLGDKLIVRHMRMLTVTKIIRKRKTTVPRMNVNPKFVCISSEPSLSNPTFSVGYSSSYPLSAVSIPKNSDILSPKARSSRYSPR